MRLEEDPVEQRALNMNLELRLRWEGDRPEQGPSRTQCSHLLSYPQGPMGSWSHTWMPGPSVSGDLPEPRGKMRGAGALQSFPVTRLSCLSTCTLGGPQVKRGSSSLLENGYGGDREHSGFVPHFPYATIVTPPGYTGVGAAPSPWDKR